MARRILRRRRLTAAGILAWLACVTAAPAAVPAAVDLTADGRIARARQVPIVIMYSRALCGWCEKARREHLDGLAAAGDAAYLLRQVDVDAGSALVDFDGRRTSHKAFARKHQARLTPTLMFFGPDGQTLAPPIAGYRLPEFYGLMIEDAVEDSRRMLQGTGQ